jgi:hypothetical protein
MYLDWISWFLEKEESHKNSAKKIKELLKKATDAWPNNSKLWERRINNIISLNVNEREESIEELYKSALKSNPASLILWDSYLSWVFENGNLEDFELEKLLLVRNYISYIIIII